MVISSVSLLRISLSPIFTRFAERVMLSRKNLRVFLCAYSVRKHMEKETFDRMHALLEKECSSLAGFMVWCGTVFERDDLIGESVMKFIKCMSSVSPVSSYFPTTNPDFKTLINDLKIGLVIRNHPMKFQGLQCMAPIIFSLLMELPEGPIPHELVCLFTDMEERVSRTFMKEPYVLPLYPPLRCLLLFPICLIGPSFEPVVFTRKTLKLVKETIQSAQKIIVVIQHLHLAYSHCIVNMVRCIFF